MSWNIGDLTDNALRLVCVDGLGGSTLSKLALEVDGLNEAGDAVISSQAQDWLPTGANATDGS